jgi:hypothetical protein
MRKPPRRSAKTERRQLRRDVVRAPVMVASVEKPSRIRRKRRRVMRKPLRVRLKKRRASLKPSRLKRLRRRRLRPLLAPKATPTRPLSAPELPRTTMQLARSHVAKMASTPTRRTVEEPAVDTVASQAGYRTICGENPRIGEGAGLSRPLLFSRAGSVRAHYLTGG